MLREEVDRKTYGNACYKMRQMLKAFRSLGCTADDMVGIAMYADDHVLGTVIRPVHLGAMIAEAECSCDEAHVDWYEMEDEADQRAYIEKYLKRSGVWEQQHLDDITDHIIERRLLHTGVITWKDIIGRAYDELGLKNPFKKDGKGGE